MTHDSPEQDEPDVAVSPTLGAIDELRSAADKHRNTQEPPKSAGGQPPYDEEDVTGGPTLGSITELRFAHHAHHPDPKPREAPTND